MTRPWTRALLAIPALGVFFFLSYGLTNWFTSRQSYVPSLAFSWERRIPFLPWTIVPYWSTDLLYPVSLLICRTRAELATHIKRLVAVQVLSSVGFLLFPLRFSFDRPEVTGFFGSLFHLLMAFDKPFNQAPSLHLGIGVVLWARYSAHLSGLPLRAMQAWLILVGLSTLTTFQHHVIDLPTGILMGLLAIALFPMQQNPAIRLSAFYLTTSLLLGCIAFRWGGIAFFFLWPATALLVPALAYATRRPQLIGKRHSAMQLLLAPYLALVWLNSRIWTHGQIPAQHISSDVWIGRAPAGETGYRSVIDVTAEFPVQFREAQYRNVPMLDLIPPSREQLRQAVSAIEEFREYRPTLVFCALGYSRSAAVIATWLLATNQTASVATAVDAIRKQRPSIRINPAHKAAIAEAIRVD